MEKKCFYITTPIYYASANLHIGHAYVFFLTGADEHGEKIAKNASKNNMTPQEFVDHVYLNFQENWKKLDISYNKFIRTTSKEHMEVV